MVKCHGRERLDNIEDAYESVPYMVSLGMGARVKHFLFLRRAKYILFRKEKRWNKRWMKVVQ